MAIRKNIKSCKYGRKGCKSKPGRKRSSKRKRSRKSSKRKSRRKSSKRKRSRKSSKRKPRRKSSKRKYKLDSEIVCRRVCRREPVIPSPSEYELSYQPPIIPPPSEFRQHSQSIHSSNVKKGNLLGYQGPERIVLSKGNKSPCSGRQEYDCKYDPNCTWTKQTSKRKAHCKVKPYGYGSYLGPMAPHPIGMQPF